MVYCQKPLATGQKYNFSLKIKLFPFSKSAVHGCSRQRNVQSIIWAKSQAPPFGKGRWLRFSEDGGIDDAGWMLVEGLKSNIEKFNKT